jgi:hypothetical protein
MQQKIARNLSDILQRMAAAAERGGRAPEDVRLLPVTKTVGVVEVRILHELGIPAFGENRVETARAKIESLAGAVRWHMIGSIQRRKVKDVVALFDCAEAVDRLELAETLQRRCEEQDKRLPILLEVNVSGESAKHGFAPSEVAESLRQIRAFDRLTVEGLMTMAPFDAPEPVLRSTFRGLRELAETLGLRELSMGMTDDFEIAIEEGATQVRIGRALFE